ncbi:hypothetical protein PYS58_03400 [Chryseobacterium indologenes]|uniref:hypothetical protein n=1 Tax=Chryseobacterium indologenes TaxID=253 RepID=UPI0023E8D100|nr:hypothetical protein [Chryseobacterium indologenes]WET50179.1 hypothetical protein PYS58_03400 [Chryseobacterium indologenes]
MIIPNRTIKNIVIPDIEQMNIQSQKEDSIQSKNSWGENRKIKRVIKNTVNNSNYSLEENDSEGLIRKLAIENSNLRTFDEVFRDKRNVIIINKEWTDYKDKPIYLTIDYHYAFYETGILKKIKCYSSYIPVGNWYLYDETGKELHHINIDKHFKMSLIQILEKASKIKIYNHQSYSIARLFDAKHSYWKLEYFKSSDEHQAGPSIVILIDDSTGKIIYKESQNHEPDYKSSGIIDYKSIFNYMQKNFKPFSE